MSRQCAPLHRLYQVPRSETLEAAIAKFPKPKKIRTNKAPLVAPDVPHRFPTKRALPFGTCM